MASNARAEAIRQNCWPTFYKEAVPLKHQSEIEGRPIFEDRDMVKIMIPGDRNLVVVQPVDEKIINQFPEQYQQFKANEAVALRGTPLEQWPQITVGQIAELKASHIRSVEDLAGLSDAQMQKLGMHGRDLRTKARLWLDAASSGAATSQIAAENAALKAQLEALQAQVAAIMAAGNAAPVASEPVDRDINDLSTEELRAYIKRETGVNPPPRAGRELLLERAMEIATRPAEVA